MIVKNELSSCDCFVCCGCVFSNDEGFLLTYVLEPPVMYWVNLRGSEKEHRLYRYLEAPLEIFISFWETF